MSKPAAQEFFGGGQAVVGLEVGQVALHDVDKEADGGAAVIGLFPDEGGQFLVEGGRIYRRERRERGVFSGWGGVGIFIDEGLGLVEAEVEELTGGVETVAGLGVFELALHDVDEEADYDAAVFGFLADDFGEGGRSGFRVDGLISC